MFSLYWWNSLSADDQMWYMLCLGYDTPLKPNRVTDEEIILVYKYAH